MSSFEKQNLENGEKNPKYVDLLDQDPEIAGQKFVCMSFVSPEKLLNNGNSLNQWKGILTLFTLFLINIV